jgi:hypothetical protein
VSPAIPSGLAIVGSATWKHAKNPYRTPLVIADEQHPPVADPQPELGTPLKTPNVTSGILGTEPIDRIQHPSRHRRVEAP